MSHIYVDQNYDVALKLLEATLKLMEENSEEEFLDTATGIKKWVETNGRVTPAQMRAIRNMYDAQVKIKKGVWRNNASFFEGEPDYGYEEDPDHGRGDYWLEDYTGSEFGDND